MGCGISTLEILGNTAIEVDMEKNANLNDMVCYILLLGGCLIAGALFWHTYHACTLRMSL